MKIDHQPPETLGERIWFTVFSAGAIAYGALLGYIAIEVTDLLFAAATKLFP